jgi:putative IMPACT (imprinted ancient) family translation regulator
LLQYAYRIVEKVAGKSSGEIIEVLKHDHEDDGEDGAGSKLSHLLQVRKEVNVLVLVSRWFGGIQLGSKRFVHIAKVAGDLLLDCHANRDGWR